MATHLTKMGLGGLQSGGGVFFLFCFFGLVPEPTKKVGSGAFSKIKVLI